MKRLPPSTPLVLIAAVAALTGGASAQDRCEVARVNKNGDSIGNPGCPDRGSLARLGGGKDSQLFLVRGDRPPEGDFSLELQNGAFDSGRFTLEDGRLRLFLSDANGQQPHSLYNYDPDGGGVVPPDPGLPPVDPTDPEFPVDPVDPTDPTDPGFPVDPTDPTDPGFPVDPVDPPPGPTDPGFPVDPTDPGAPVAPAGPDTGDRGVEQALTGIGALPIFTEPYTITERLVGWGFGGENGGPSTGGPDEERRRAWFQAGASRFDDSRYGRDGDGSRDEVIVGFDLARQPDLILGLAGGWETAQADAFNGSQDISYDGWLFGPYAAWIPREDFVLDLWVGYARRDVTSEIAGLESDYAINRVFVSANATGRYFHRDFEIRPKLEVFYSNDETLTHEYRSGGAAGIPEDYSLRIDGGHDNLLFSSLSADVRRSYLTRSGAVIEPFAGLSVDAWLDRPNDGQLVGGDLTLQSTDSVTGAVEAGVAMRFENGGRLDVRAAYGSIGDGDLSDYGGSIAFSLPF